jgi:hypothetical protein
MNSQETSARRGDVSRGRTLLVLLAVFLATTAASFHSLPTVLPYLHNPDEVVDEGVALRVAHAPAKSPEFFRYPSLLFYTQALVYRADELFSGVRIEPAVVDSLGNARTSHPRHWLLGRALTATTEALLAALAAWLTISLSGHWLPGLAVGILTALSPLLAEQSRHIAPDTYAAFFTMAALAAAARLAVSDALSVYCVSGVLVGLAAGSKYNLALVAIAVLWAHLSRKGLRGVLDPRLYLAGVLAVLTFAATTPYAVLDRSSFLAGISFEARHYSKGHAGSEGGTVAFYARCLWEACGPWMLLAPGVFLLEDRDTRRATLPILGFCVLYFAFLSSFVVHFERNALPLVAPLIMLGALALHGLWLKLRARASTPLASRLAAGALALMFGFSVVNDTAAVLQQGRDRRVNPRSTAERWIRENVPKGSDITLEGYTPWVEPSDYRLHSVHNFSEVTERELTRSTRYVVLAARMYQRFFADPSRYRAQKRHYQVLMGKYCQIARFNEGSEDELRILDLRCRR